MPEETTRAAALKKGEVDIVYLLSGPVAEDIKRTPEIGAMQKTTGLGRPIPTGCKNPESNIPRQTSGMKNDSTISITGEPAQVPA